MPLKPLSRRERRELYTSLAGELVIMAGTVMLAYYFEYTDTFSVHVQGFFCYDTAYTKPYLGPEDSSAVPPVLLYALVAGLPTLLTKQSLLCPVQPAEAIEEEGVSRPSPSPPPDSTST